VYGRIIPRAVHIREELILNALNVSNKLQFHTIILSRSVCDYRRGLDW
jgi:hypothetical protein